MKKKIFIAITTIIVLFVAFNMLKPLSVEVESVTNKDFVKETVLTGRLMIVKQSVVKSRISGDVKEVLVVNGQQVQKGDVLIKIDSSQYYQNYQVILKDIDKAISALDQYIDTNRDNLGDPEIIHGRQILELALQQARSKNVSSLIGFKDYSILAPITGRFYFSNFKDLNVGEYVIVNSEIGKVFDPTNLKVNVGITPDEFSALKNIEKVKVQIEGLDTRVNAKINQISDAIGKNDNGDDVLFISFDILDTVDDIYKKDGLNSKVYIEKPAGKMLGISFSSIFSEKSNDYVYLVKNGKAVKTEIKIIDDFGDYLSIENNNVKENDQIIKVIDKGLKDGKRVTIK